MARPRQNKLILTPVVRGADFAGYEEQYLQYEVWIDTLPDWMQSYHRYIVPYATVKNSSGVLMQTDFPGEIKLSAGYIQLGIYNVPAAGFKGTIQIGYQEFVDNVLKNKSPLSNPWPVTYAGKPTPTPPPKQTPPPPRRRYPTPAPPIGVLRRVSAGENIISQILRGMK